MNRDQLFNNITDHQPGRAEFETLMNRYDAHLMAFARNLSAAVADPDVLPEDTPEADAFTAVTRADYAAAKEIVKSMAATDRAVFLFWLEEAQSLVTDVQITEQRY